MCLLGWAEEKSQKCREYPIKPPEENRKQELSTDVKSSARKIRVRRGDHVVFLFLGPLSSPPRLADKVGVAVGLALFISLLVRLSFRHCQNRAKTPKTTKCNW